MVISYKFEKYINTCNLKSINGLEPVQVNKRVISSFFVFFCLFFLSAKLGATSGNRTTVTNH